MKKITSLLVLLLGIQPLLLAQTNSPAGAGAAGIAFDGPIYNFGRAKSGETIKHDFVFTNTGTAALVITDVKPGCGCTTAGAWDKSVEPGKTGVIPLQFNSTGFGGQVAKSATITCNDPAHTNVFLQITGTVWKPIDVIPNMTMFNVFAEWPTNETKIVKLVNNLDEPVTLSDVQSSSPSFKAELKEVKPGKEFELQVTVLPPITVPTIFSTITLKSSSTNSPIVSLSAYAVVQQPVSVSPQQITLPAGPLKAPVNTAVLVRNNSTNALQISDVKLELPGVDIKVTEPQTNRLFSIIMTFPVGFELPAGKQPELMMKSSHPKFPEIKVPVVQNKLVAASAPVSTLSSPGLLRTASPLAPTK